MSKIAVVLGEGFEDIEFQMPYTTLQEHRHDIVVVGSERGKVTGKGGLEVSIDASVGDTSPDGFDALVIPGGYSPDHLRTDPAMVDFTRTFMTRGLPVAAVCHGPSLLIEAGVVEGRTLTSWPSIRTDLTNAGATVVDEEVTVDGNLITSRNPDDLGAFIRTLVDHLEPSQSSDASHDDPHLRRVQGDTGFPGEVIDDESNQPGSQAFPDGVGVTSTPITDARSR